MKVILNETVPKVGKRGQVVNVANGFARNFLFPRGLAVVADKGQLKVLELRRAKLEKLDSETLSSAESVREKIHGKEVRIEAKAGADTTKLFGAVTSQDIADAIKSQLKVELEKKQIGLLTPIKRLGRHKVEIDLHRQVDASVELFVFDPEHPTEEPAEAKTAEAASEEPE
ncbi:MAG: 50S ribosomal protein L9 [Fimbriimonadaceae bacterium]|nr:50S ribosomal protein L9 [Fimbriimonadaceae bacterium]MCC6351016.1 50S ribosomal protein L9 [Fimbriimonadaceae bacterium]